MSDTDTDAVATLNFPGNATMAGTFTNAMNDRNSPEFQQVQNQFCSQVSISWISADFKFVMFMVHHIIYNGLFQISDVMQGSSLSDVYDGCEVLEIR